MTRKWTYWHVVVESDDPKNPVGVFLGLNKQQKELCRIEINSLKPVPYVKLQFLERILSKDCKENLQELGKRLEELAKPFILPAGEKT